MDTTGVYGDGHSEHIVAKSLSKYLGTSEVCHESFYQPYYSYLAIENQKSI